MHVYFPDPWWKKRHKKRRVFTAELVAQIERTLQARRASSAWPATSRSTSVIRGLIAAERAVSRTEPVPRARGPSTTLDYLTQLRAEIPPRRTADLPGHLRAGD